MLNLLMVRRPSVGAADVDEHVEPDQRDADRLLELAAQQIGETAVGAHEEAHELQPLVVDLRQDAAGAAVELRVRLVLVLHPAWGYSPCSYRSLSSPQRIRNSRLPD